MGRDGINFGSSLQGGLPYQPWLAALVKKRTAEESKDDPHVVCLPDTFLRMYSLPHLTKFVQTAGLLIMLNESERRVPPGVSRQSPAADRPRAVVAGLLVGEVGGRHARRSRRTASATTSGSTGTEA